MQVEMKDWQIVHKTLMDLMGCFSSANIYKDRLNTKVGVYWYHIGLYGYIHKYQYSSISYQDNQLDTCLLFGGFT